MTEESYTPTTNEVRNAYRLSDQDIDGSPYLPEKSDAEFDRWLAGVKADARREGQADAWEQGYSDCWTYHQSNGLSGSRENPYRQEADQ